MSASRDIVPRADLHTHTALCKHASGTPEEYLAAAQDAGLAYWGVSPVIVPRPTMVPMVLLGNMSPIVEKRLALQA